MAKTANKRWIKITAIVLASILAFILIAIACCEIATRIADRWDPWRPDYEPLSQEQMMEILTKEELTEEDYSILYAQTGLTKIGIDRILDNPHINKYSKIISIQQNYFADYGVIDDRFAPFTCWELLDGGVSLLPDIKAILTKQNQPLRTMLLLWCLDQRLIRIQEMMLPIL